MRDKVTLIRNDFMKKYDYIVIGAGIIGLTIARELKQRFKAKSVAILEKESTVAFHASGRNSGVLHAGFYYSKDSLKAKFTKDGNKLMKSYCQQNHLKINECGKLVVATNEQEMNELSELKRRADYNGVELLWVDEKNMAEIEPNAKTYKKALFSPSTASVSPTEVCQTLLEENLRNQIDVYFDSGFVKRIGNVVVTEKDQFEGEHIINCAGLYADKIAHEYEFGRDYVIIPFKGLYLKYKKNTTDIRTNIYPVPNLKNPFLGVHFTKTVDGEIKIGPTAIPAFWREHYRGLENFKWNEFVQICSKEAKLFLKNSFNFRSLAFEEMAKYRRSHFINLSLKLVKDLDVNGFGDFLKPGIRAQLLNKKTNMLVQDFVVEGDKYSTHVLNAVSPAFTCSFPFATYVIDRLVKNQKKMELIEC
jgi:L-2-hydroxyglutarate oxidase